MQRLPLRPQGQQPRRFPLPGKHEVRVVSADTHSAAESCYAVETVSTISLSPESVYLQHDQFLSGNTVQLPFPEAISAMRS
jgi:hypothetical protein